MNDWLVALHEWLQTGKPCVRVVVANVIGSAPREMGASMLVGADTAAGSIGGGHLEWKAIEIAREMLAPQSSLTSTRPAPIRVERILLGAMLGQCCGGAVELWLEHFDAAAADVIANTLSQRGKGLLLLTRSTLTSSAPTHERYVIDRDYVAAFDPTLPAHVDTASFDTAGVALLHAHNGTTALVERIDLPHKELWLFGAGHVGKALVKILADMPLRITWVDSRKDMFAPRLPHNIVPLCTEYPLDVVRTAPRDAWYLVMTHSHDLDYEICRAVLMRDDFAWLGLIGSHTKATHFRNRLQRHGIDSDTIVRMICPIGLPSVSSKLPTAIAVSVAAQLIGLFEQCNFGSFQELNVARTRTHNNTASRNTSRNAIKKSADEAPSRSRQTQLLHNSHPPGPSA
jgi:xanthine dehydrogenase accessory factor